MSYKISEYSKKDKPCTKCKLVKLLSEFSIGKDNRGVERWASWCRDCVREDNKIRSYKRYEESKKKKKKNKPNNYYLSNKELYMEIIVSKAQGKLTKDAQKMIALIGENVIKKFYYKNIQDKEDCLSNGMYQAYKNWMLFNELKTDNPFAYFSEIFKRGMAKGWNVVNKNRDRTISMQGFYEDGGDLNI